VNAGTVNYTTASTAACSAEQVARHDAVYNGQNRMDAIDPDGHFIGYSEGDGELWRNWEPVDGYKHVACGVQTHYGYYVGPWYGYAGEERDTNQFLLLSSPFQFLIDNSIQWGLASAGSVHREQCGNQACLESEITYHEDYNSNPWVPANPYSALDEMSVCTYGPWVADHGHDGRPEIHPAETIWWSMPVPPGSPHVLRESRVVMLQDASRRYSDRVDDFVPDMPANLKPWAGFPRTAFVRYAFKVPSSVTPREYLHVIDSGRKRTVSTSADAALSVDATDGAVHALAFNGVPRFSIVENQPDHELGAVFDENPSQANRLHDVCVRSDGTLQGYATLKSRFGSSSADQAGFQELLLRHTSGAPAAKIVYGFPPNTIRTVGFGGAGSSDSDGTIVSYRWSFGDGTISTAANPTKSYANYGVYSVQLTVTDNDGNTASDNKLVNVPLNPLQLENGVGIAPHSRAAAPKYFIEVPQGASNLRFEIEEFDVHLSELREADLYVKFGSAPTGSSYDCAPRLLLNGNESCEFPDPAAGIWWIKVFPEEWVERRRVVVKASYTVNP
jgi:hypothetical protein